MPGSVYDEGVGDACDDDEECEEEPPGEDAGGMTQGGWGG